MVQDELPLLCRHGSFRPLDDRLIRLRRRPQLPLNFQIHPDFRTSAKGSAQFLGSLGGYGFPGVDDLINHLQRPADNPCQIALAPATRLQFLADEIARRKYLRSRTNVLDRDSPANDSPQC